MTVPALLWMDRWGRRPTLLIGAFLMCLWLCVNGALFAAYSREPYPGEFTSTAESMAVSGAPAKAIIASTFLFVASYAPTWGPVSWTYPPELYPLRLRGKAVALCTSANWAFNFALAYFVPPAFAQITWKVYIVFATFCAVMFLHVFFLFPETANKPLEEIEGIFDDTKPGGECLRGCPCETTQAKMLTTSECVRQLSSTLVLQLGRRRTTARPWSSGSAAKPPRTRRTRLKCPRSRR